MRESLTRIREASAKLWQEASAVKRGLFVAAPVVLIAAITAGVAFAVSSGGGEASHEVLAPTPAASATAQPTDTATPLPTETPASAGLQEPPAQGQQSANSGAPRAVVNPNLSGPGPSLGTSYTLSIPVIGVNASVSSRTVGQNGQMGNPTGPWDVVFYDFSGWPGLGGRPGDPGANVVMAGHVDYIHVGPAVFWSLRDLQAGAQIVVNTPGGPITYAVQWVQWADPSADFTQFVSQTGQESITLVTCVGSFSGGHYSNRLIVRGNRI